MNSLVSINIFQGKINRGIKKVVVAQSDKMKNKDIRIPKKYRQILMCVSLELFIKQ